MKKNIVRNIICVVCLIIIILGVVLSIKPFRLKKILDKIDTYKDVENYYAKIETWEEEDNNSSEKKNFKTQEIFFKDGIMKMTLDNMVVWINYNANEGYAIDLNKKEAKKLDAQLIKDYNAPDKDTISSFGPTILVDNFFDYYTTNLKIKSNDGYYVLYNEKDEYKIDKDTGLPELYTLKTSTETQYTKYEINLNAVESNKIEMPNLSEYKII